MGRLITARISLTHKLITAVNAVILDRKMSFKDVAF